MKRRLAAVAFAVQFVIEGLLFHGVRPWLERPRVLLDVAATAALWALVLLCATTRARRAVVAVTAATLLVAQAMVFRYYHAPLDVQVAASALHVWHDVRLVVIRAAPALVATIAVVSAIEWALLSLVHAARETRELRLPAPLLGLAATAGLFGLGPRHATPDVRALHALSALRAPPRPAQAASGVSLPSLHVERAETPSVLFVLTESVRARDYDASGASPTAAETRKVTPSRVDLAQMRAISSYTAVSLSAVLTGRSQEGARDAILRAPSLFDFARAARDARGSRPTVSYFSAQSETVFEAKDVRASVDRFVTIETLRGRDVEDDADYAELPLDADVVDAFVAKLPEIEEPSVTVLHLVGTHAPYFVDRARAPFQPYDHVVTWSGMPKLHNAYKNAIVEQDRKVARAVAAFIAHAGSRPWIVAFTSDHGESFGEHGAIHHGQNLMDEQIHVPAWIAFGGGALDAAESRALADHGARFVTHLDLLPTLLDAMGLWDNFAVAPHRAAMPGRSLLRPWEARAPIPVTNCTGMFPCPLNTWGVLAGDRKLVARLWDGGWSCFALGGSEERAAPEPSCERLRAVSRVAFPLLPNGAPNR
ncbi:MAG: sulfatase-like hydrolase/transferase [Labilithrix sp.]|nr:sulfatase-like hydrolase/transferase [Labilithrix sp.]